MVNRGSILFVGGVDDPEMRTVERLAVYAGCRFVDAVDGDNQPLKPENAYRAFLPESVIVDDETHIVTVESGLVDDTYPVVAKVDHHNIGDYGYDKTPREAWVGSSIGQTTNLLARLGILPQLSSAELRELQTYGAMDHCLAAAIQGKTPGVKPSDVVELSMAETAKTHMTSSTQVRRHIMNMSTELVRSRVCEYKGEPIIDARHVSLGKPYSLGHLCINLASASMGRPAVVELETDISHMQKVVLVGGYQPSQVEAFRCFAAEQGLQNIYAVPCRGVAGGYLHI